MIPIEGLLDNLEVEFDPDRDGNQKVHCPFHEDSVASASVNLGKGLFNCYGCQMSGDAIALIMRTEGLEFRAAKQLAEEMAQLSGRQVSRESGREDGLLPRKKGTRPNRRQWKSPWSRRES